MNLEKTPVFITSSDLITENMKLIFTDTAWIQENSYYASWSILPYARNRTGLSSQLNMTNIEFRFPALEKAKHKGVIDYNRATSRLEAVILPRGRNVWEWQECPTKNRSENTNQRWGIMVGIQHNF